MWFHWYKTPELVNFIDTENRMVVTRSCGKGAMGNYHLMSTKFLFGKVKTFWKWIMMMVAQQYEVLNST